MDSCDARLPAFLSASLIYWQVHRQKAWDEIFLKSSHDLDSQLCLPGAASAHNLIGRCSSLMVHVEISLPDTIAVALKKKKAEKSKWNQAAIIIGLFKNVFCLSAWKKKCLVFSPLSSRGLSSSFPHQKTKKQSL